jgi:hypothetical protein
MAQDWIRVRTDLGRDPKVIRLATLLSRDASRDARDGVTTASRLRHAVIGALCAVWGVTRHNGVTVGHDLRVTQCDHDAVDTIADWPGFAAAMEQVGWLVIDDGNALFPNYLRHNTATTGPQRSAEAERARRYRERRRQSSRTVTRDAAVMTRHVTSRVTRPVE